MCRKVWNILVHRINKRWNGKQMSSLKIWLFWSIVMCQNPWKSKGDLNQRPSDNGLGTLPLDHQGRWEKKFFDKYLKCWKLSGISFCKINWWILIQPIMFLGNASKQPNIQRRHLLTILLLIYSMLTPVCSSTTEILSSSVHDSPPPSTTKIATNHILRQNQYITYFFQKKRCLRNLIFFLSCCRNLQFQSSTKNTTEDDLLFQNLW